MALWRRLGAVAAVAVACASAAPMAAAQDDGPDLSTTTTVGEGTTTVPSPTTTSLVDADPTTTLGEVEMPDVPPVDETPASFEGDQAVALAVCLVVCAAGVVVGRG